MRGANIVNLYIIEDKEYKYTELSSKQITYINSIADKSKYNNFRNTILEHEGDNVECKIKIKFPDQKLTAFDEFGVQLIY
jgi:hypothetical protein